MISWDDLQVALWLLANPSSRRISPSAPVQLGSSTHLALTPDPLAAAALAALAYVASFEMKW